MDKRSLFGEVDLAVERALDARVSKLDSIDLDEWTPDVLKEDAEAVNSMIKSTCEEYGWTMDDYNAIILRLTDNRHTPKRAKESHNG